MGVWGDLKKKQQDERNKLKKSRSLSFNPFKIVDQARSVGGNEYKSNISKGVNALKAAEIAKISGITDIDYVEYLLNEKEPSNISISEFIDKARKGKYDGLSNRRQYDGGRQYDDSRQYDNLIDILKEIKTGPSEKMFEAMVGDYASPGTSMSNRKSELAKLMDKYAQLTNNFNISKVNLEEKLKILKASWGDSLGMGYEEREKQLDPFLRGTLPLMEVKSENYEN